LASNVLATKMADLSVCFSGSSFEEVEHCKRLWQSIYPAVKPKSALVIKGIDHRLNTAPLPQKGKKMSCFVVVVAQSELTIMSDLKCRFL